jgi:hypothetical protein
MAVSASFTSAYFGGLSISSLASDDYSDRDDNGSVQSQVELYRRLQDLEQITDDLLTNKSILLSSEHDAFGEVELGHIQNFDLHVPVFDRSHVLLLSVSCLPDCNDQHVPRSLHGTASRSQSYQPLDVVLRRSVIAGTHGGPGHTDDQAECYYPQCHEDVYSFALTSAHHFGMGRFTLSVQMDVGSESEAKKHYQPIRVSYKISPQARTTPIECGSRVIGSVGYNEYKYFR